LSINPIEATASQTPKRRLIGLTHLDNRTRAARRARQITRSLQRQLRAKPTIQQTLAIERCACLAVISEDLRSRLLAGESVGVDTVIRAENVAARAWKAVQAMLGARKTAPSLAAYLRDVHRGEA
jgi:hypothetical protein